MSNHNNSGPYNPEKLRAMIKGGMAAREIMNELRISPHALMENLVMLQELDRNVYIIEGLFDYPEKRKSKFRKEGIVFHKEVLEKIGFKPGDAFEMRASGSQIILDKIRID
jgi:hypothetical protein